MCIMVCGITVFVLMSHSLAIYTLGNSLCGFHTMASNILVAVAIAQVIFQMNVKTLFVLIARSLAMNRVIVNLLHVVVFVRALKILLVVARIPGFRLLILLRLMFILMFLKFLI